MNREKNLLKNFGILSIGNISVKLVTFLLIPLYTSYLSTKDFGLFEIVINTTSLLIPITTLDIADATVRFAMEAKVSSSEVFKISIKYCLIGTIVTFSMLLVNHVFGIVAFLIGAEGLVLTIYFLCALLGVLVGYAKALNKVKNVAISSAIATIVTGGLNIFLLVFLKAGITGYFMAYVVGIAIQVAYLCLSVKDCHYGIKIIYDKELERAMLKYSVPLIVNNVAWWGNSALDRYIVTFFCGIAENGIYSLAYKIPTIISMMQSLFHQAWTLSAIQEYDSDDSKQYFRTTYNAYNFILIMLCSVLILANRTIARIMYAKEFIDAWRYVPYLCIGFVFLGLANCVGAVFNALKQSKLIALSTLASALLNCLLNFILIPHFGALGAAFATAFSYMIIWLIRLMLLKKKMDMNFFSFRDCISYGILFVGTVDVVYDDVNHVILHVLMIFVLVVLYRGEMLFFIKKISGKRNIKG